jgi:tricorn protease
MRKLSVLVLLTLLYVAFVASADGQAQVRPHGALLRYPDVSATHIVFTYAGDLWLVPREGGQAVPVASPPGSEVLARFSPDGRTIAFMGHYEAGTDLYTLPVAGGVPFRVTHHPASELMCDWTPDGDLLFFSYGYWGPGFQSHLFTVPPTGGLPARLPVPYGAFGSISPDGEWLAYVPHTIDFATWKRYRGGMATDIWLFNLRTRQSKRITDWEGIDSLPMWDGQVVYYVSDAGRGHRLNIWSYDTRNGRRRQITDFSDYDVKWPSIGPGPEGKGEIVFQCGPELRLLDLGTRESRAVQVLVPGDRRTLKPQRVDAARHISDGAISSTGKRAAVSARGDVWTIPAENGSPRAITRTDGSFERSPSWSPDGRWIAYFSDETGEYQLYTVQSDGKEEPRKVTDLAPGFYEGGTWSPDSKHMVFQDQAGRIWLHTIESGNTQELDRDPGGHPGRVSWSHDSNWIAYTKESETRLPAVWLCNVATGEKHQVTSGFFADSRPTFDRKGEFLYFASNRVFARPTYDDFHSSWVYENTDTLLMVPLRKDVESPLKLKVDEETWKEEPKDEGKKDDEAKPKDEEQKPEDGNEKAKDGEKQPKDEQEKEKEPLKIDVEGFEGRAIRLPVPSGSFQGLAVNHSGQLFYLRTAPGPPAIMLFEVKDGEGSEKQVLAGAGMFEMCADGKKLLVAQGPRLAIVNAAPGQSMGKPLSTAGMTPSIDPREEWKQIFRDAWRLYRDFFYASNMHGVDWEGVRRQYEPMLEDCVSRADVNFVLGEMMGELNVGHAYLMGGGDTEETPEPNTGMLGVDFEPGDGAYRIAHIHQGAAWDDDARGPLGSPGTKVEEGDYLLAVNGVTLDVTKDPWAAFEGLAGRVTILRVSEKPETDDSAREVIIRPLPSEEDLRYRAWVEHNRAYVAAQTDGKVGYIHVPNTAIEGDNELYRQFIGQMTKEALIIDERWNGGGFVPDRLVELLNRPVLSYHHGRYTVDGPSPGISHQGPKCMLINGLAGSGGDMFPYYFKKAGVGKLIGTRTWGGVIGLSGNPQLIDGGYVSVPQWAMYETDGTWGVEGHGVDPDINVLDDPAKMWNGADPQLDAAIKYMLEEIRRHPYKPPKRPDYPDRSGMGLSGRDR